MRPEEDLERIFTWREWRKVSSRLTLQYDRTLYLITDQPERRSLVHRYVEVAEYPDGRIELWADGISLPYVLYDRLSEIDQGAIVENKRLGHVLEIAQHMQAQRDNRRIQALPSRTLIGQSLRHPELRVPGTKAQRQLNSEDLRRAIDKLGPPPPPCRCLTASGQLDCPTQTSKKDTQKEEHHPPLTGHSDLATERTF